MIRTIPAPAPAPVNKARKVNPGFIDASYKLYQKTGNLRPLMREYQDLTLHLCSRAGLLDELNYGDLWGEFFERLAVALKAFRSCRKSRPFSYFWGVIAQHIRLVLMRRNPLKNSVLFEDPFEIDYLNSELPGQYHTIRYHNNLPYQQHFFRELEMAADEGKDILTARSQTLLKFPKYKKELDLLIVKLRREMLNHEVL